MKLKQVLKIFGKLLDFCKKYLLLRPGKSYTACSLGIPQGLTAARVLGCSGAM
jgi:hypothetical protein